MIIEQKKKRITDLRKEANILKKAVDYNNAMQQAFKIVLNGSYGAFATQYFILFNNKVAGTITAEGRALTKTMSEVNEDYWYNQWHLETELHNKLKIKNVTQIPANKSVSVYGDSVDGDSIINVKIGNDNKSLKIKDLFTDTVKSIREDKEIYPVNFSALNWRDENEGIYYAKVKNIIRHKVSKAKWKLRLESDKEIIVTSDHSMIVFRDGIKMEVKPNEILGTDNVLTSSVSNYKYEYEEIESIEQIGMFEDEYVYDLEMEDESHTFIANDILVHNTDSIFVSFKAALDSCDWQNKLFHPNVLNNLPKRYSIVLESEEQKNEFIEFNNDNFVKFYYPNNLETWDFSDISDNELLLVDGNLLKNWDLNSIEEYNNFEPKHYNWKAELELIHGLDKFRIEQFFKDELCKHAESYGVENIEDFELEKIADSVINVTKKKYVQNIVFEDGIYYDSLTYLQPKGIELVRSSTPVFAREKIPEVINYLFSKPESFNIKELMTKVKAIRKEFELADIDSISMQSSCNKYNEKVLSDKGKLKFVVGTHFAVKAAAHHNLLLTNEKALQTTYAFLKSGDKIKYFYCTDKEKPIFAFKRGDYPIEFAPQIDYDVQFMKSILSPINSIIKPLGLPEISKRLSVVMDIFGGLGMVSQSEKEEDYDWFD